jgi:tetratricopeptide (TPR) repeat protein
VSEKNNFFAKSIEYLEKSLKINNMNYLVHFNLSKLYAYLGKVDESLEYAKNACTYNKSDLNSLILCSLLYSARDENQKARMIID